MRSHQRSALLLLPRPGALDLLQNLGRLVPFHLDTGTVFDAHSWQAQALSSREIPQGGGELLDVAAPQPHQLGRAIGQHPVPGGEAATGLLQQRPLLGQRPTVP